MRYERAKPFSNGIEDGMECARFDKELFPNVLVEAWDGEEQYIWHHCPFYAKEEGAE